MSADSLVILPMQRGARSSTVDRTGPLRFVGRASADPVAALADRMRLDFVSAVDVDEVAAILEANGINDRVAAREYGVPSVFALAGRVVSRTLDTAETLVYAPVRADGPSAGTAVVDTVVRAAIYLTPLAIGLGASAQVAGVPQLATGGTLLLGWGGGQALSYLGYRALSERGKTAAARLLGAGFLVLCALWTLVLLGSGLRAHVVATTQLALFAVAAAALVTNRERIVLAAAAPCWLAAGALTAGAGRWAVVMLLCGVVGLLVVAYRPVIGADRGGRLPLRRWRSWRGDIGYAMLYCLVGTGQAALLRVVALDGIAPNRIPIEAVPLLLGVPVVELTLVWHQRRVADARAMLVDRVAFDHRLARISAGTVAALCVPVVVGAGIAGAVWLQLIGPHGQAFAASVLLTGVYALCLVLAAYGRAGTAALIVWWPTLLVSGVGHWAPALVHVAPTFTETLTVATLLGAGLPGLAVAAFVLRDPESYR